MFHTTGSDKGVGWKLNFKLESYTIYILWSGCVSVFPNIR